jgi:hypothetical protein
MKTVHPLWKGIVQYATWDLTMTLEGRCVCCKALAGPKCHTPLGHKEYHISGLCEDCFDVMFGEVTEIALKGWDDRGNQTEG